MESNKILSEFLKVFLNDKKEKVCFVNSYIDCFKDNELLKNCDIFVIDLKDNYSPLAPFLQILQALEPSENQLNENVFPLFLPAFSGYLNNGKVIIRKDDIILGQTFYEIKECRESIIKLIEILKAKKFLILNSQHLSVEAIEIIEELEKSKTKSKFIFSFDITETLTTSKRLTKLFTRIQDKKSYLEIVGDFKIESAKNNKNLSEVFKNFDDLVTVIRNIRAFRAIDQQLSLNNRIIKEINSYQITKKQYRTLIYGIALSFYTANDINNASTYFNMVLNSTEDDVLTVNSLYYLGCTYYEKRDNAKASKYASIVMQKIRNNKDSLMYAYAVKLSYISCARTTQKVLINLYEKACEILKKNDLLTNYVDTILNVPTCYLDEPETLKDKVLYYLFDDLDKFENLKNDYILASVYNDIGIIYGMLKEDDKAQKYYDLSEKLRNKIGELSFIIRQKNLFSYNNLTCAKYKASYEVLKPYTSNFKDLKDFGEITDTLRNIVLPFFYTRNYKNAYTLLNLIIYILKLFNYDKIVNNSYVPEISNIKIYKTVIDIANEDYVRAEFSFNNLISSKNHYSNCLKPFLFYIKAAILLNSNNFDEAIDLFEEGFFYFTSVTEPKEHSEVFILYEFSRLLKKLGYQQDSDIYFKRGFKIAKDSNLTFYTKGKNFLTLEEFDNDFLDLGELNFDPVYLQAFAEKEKITNDLHSKVLDSQFLNRIISISNENDSIKKYVNIVLKSILDYTACESAVYIEETSKKWNFYSVSANGDRITLPENYEYYFNLSNSRKIVRDKISNCYFANLSKFKYRLGFVIIPNEKNKYILDNIPILDIVMSVIQNKLIMKKQQESLITTSTYDSLSGLNNRASLIDFLDITGNKIQRLIQKEKNIPLYTVCFIDLDNFKYYNDNFGHKVGDYMISFFSELLKNSFRHVDFISRFGGDEFVIILPETPPENCKLLAERLYKSLENKNYFIPELESILNRKILIPRNRCLSFSMGICSNFDIPDKADLQEVVKYADIAMYNSKKDGKSKCSIWKKDLYCEL